MLSTPYQARTPFLDWTLYRWTILVMALLMLSIGSEGVTADSTSEDLDNPTVMERFPKPTGNVSGEVISDTQYLADHTRYPKPHICLRARA